MTSKFSKFASDIFLQKYSMDLPCGRKETWAEASLRVSSSVLGAINASEGLVREVASLIENRQFMPGGRYLYGSGRPIHQTQNCVLGSVEDTTEGWSVSLYNSSRTLMSGAGLGIEYSKLRCEGTPLLSKGGFASGPIALMKMTNEVARGVMSGGARRAALWAGLNWQHGDIFKFISLKDWSKSVRKLKSEDFNFPACMDGTNISVGLDDEFFEAYYNQDNPKHSLANNVYWSVIKKMLSTGEPGFSIDCGENTGEVLRNACTEITSSDDSDICNLGSINMARIGSLEEMERVTRLGTLFLLAGTIYSDLPYDKIKEVRTKNRRLGLGLLGIHEWLLRRGKRYGPDAELQKYLEIYKDTSRNSADFNSDILGIGRPVKVRAIAPTGTIGILSESSTGCEPIFAAAYKRRYLKGNSWAYQFVVDPIAKALVDSGIHPDSIEDAYSISPQRRVEFQVWLQGFVDHGISSTINIPAWGSESNNEDTVMEFGNMLLPNLPKLRGITCFPDGARNGQPLTSVSYKTAMKNIGEVFYESVDICDLKGGSCGA
jgi:ribonucleoside-diphosphate reductase alpha chain